MLLQEGDTPLHDAVRHNRLKIIELLLLHDADTSLTNQVTRASSLRCSHRPRRRAQES